MGTSNNYVNKIQELLKPFKTAEIQLAIDQLDNKTAAGPDRWLNVAAIRTIGADRLSTLFNLFFVLDKIPSLVTNSYSILIPKSDKASKALKDWRPITVGSLFARLVAKVIVNRLSVYVKHHSRQRAFVPTEGTANNIFVLKDVIDNCRRNLSQLNLAFLDISKAFDSIPHNAIWFSLDKAGVPAKIINLIKELYRTCETAFTFKGSQTPPIKILNGVKQGCPLSPFLFNLVLDSLLFRLNDKKYGVDINGHKTNALAFADDLVLMTSSKYEMQASLNFVNDFFTRLSMQLNPSKCETLRLAKARDVKILKLDTSTAFTINDKIIKPCVFNKTIKYLGVNINH